MGQFQGAGGYLTCFHHCLHESSIEETIGNGEEEAIENGEEETIEKGKKGSGGCVYTAVF